MIKHFGLPWRETYQDSCIYGIRRASRENRDGHYIDPLESAYSLGTQATAHERGYHDYSTGFRCCTDFGG